MSMLDLIRDLYPDLRSITGEGNRRLLRYVKEHFLPELMIHEVPSGTKCLDWVVPPEWNCRAARLTAPDGKVVADMDTHNLHLLNYSIPFTGEVTWDELERHLYTAPDHASLIPYRTSYYYRDWGFCVTDKVKRNLPREGVYRVEIDSTLDEAGSLSYGEWFLPGETDQEIFISTHICHPQLAIDNLSSVAVAAELGCRLANQERGRLGVRILFVPGTIGPVVYLSRNKGWDVAPPAYSFVLALAGAHGLIHLKPPGPGRQTNFNIAKDTVRATGRSFTALPYEPYGYDERQYNTLGPHFQAARIGRANYGGYPEYHTSGDTPALVSSNNLSDTLHYLQDLVTACQESRRYTSAMRMGEPQYSRYGAFEAIAKVWPERFEREQAMYWLMNHADHSPLVDIVQVSKLPLEAVEAVARVLVGLGLLMED